MRKILNSKTAGRWSRFSPVLLEYPKEKWLSNTRERVHDQSTNGTIQNISIVACHSEQPEIGINGVIWYDDHRFHGAAIRADE
jgi:hypothetical protein